MKPYQFIILRYCPDAVTQEFANVGVVLYVPGRVLETRFNNRVMRLHALFDEVDKSLFKKRISQLRKEFRAISQRIESQMPTETNDLEQLVRSILPVDDSSLQWSEVKGGMGEDMVAEIDSIYERIVCRYEKSSPKRKDDDAVWNVFRQSFEKRGITERLVEKQLVTPDYSYQFDHAWKNGQWNLYQPLSFDYVETSSIVEKGNDWLGRGIALKDAPEPHKFCFLVGDAETDQRNRAVEKAMNLIHKIGGNQVEFVREHEREQFSDQLKAEMDSHDYGYGSVDYESESDKVKIHLLNED